MYAFMMASGQGGGGGGIFSGGGGAGQYDTDLYQKAVNMVAGGLVEHNDSKNLPPRRGMTQGQFNNLVENLTLTDLKEYGNGTPVIGDELLTPDDLDNDQISLKTLGSGQYGVYHERQNRWVQTQKGATYRLSLADVYK